MENIKFGEFYFVFGKNDLFANINDIKRVTEEMVNVKTEIINVEHGHTAYILTRDMSHV